MVAGAVMLFAIGMFMLGRWTAFQNNPAVAWVPWMLAVIIALAVAVFADEEADL